MSARITTASLAARQEAFEARTGEALLQLTELLTQAVAQFATPAPVAEITSAPSVRKAANKSASKARKIAHKNAPKAGTNTAKSTSEWVAEKGALSPVNKALAAAKLDGAWADRWLNESAVKAALASLTVAQRKAALPYVQARMTKAIERASA
jgi:hypothetical protein